MITAKFYQKKEQGTIYMVIKGHALSAPKGQDLICASVTMIAYTAAQTVQFMHEFGKLKKKPKIDIKDGVAEIVATPTDEAMAEALHTFWVAQCGMHVLAHNYPNYVKLEYLTV